MYKEEVKMNKVRVNYYYVPICTESFATLDRLKKFFKSVKDINFQHFDISEVKREDLPVGASGEKTFLDDLYANKAALIYGKLYINDQVIPGFPPSSQVIKETLRDLCLEGDGDLLKAYYNGPENKSILIHKNFKTRAINKENSKDLCLLCTKYSRYISEENYKKTNWSIYENHKSDHLKICIDKNEVIAFIEYLDGEPVGFIEGYSCKKAASYGFPVDDLKQGSMITCLHLREEIKGQGISKKLIKKFTEASKNLAYESVEILAFPNEMNWQPIALYEKMNFKAVKTIDKLSLMSLKL